ncbi:hypothetical protein C2G38_2174380 [Gigaspora rosea]|uniref:Uncharacterized protein n=1 Tax=Gigaspora rosea TaxID=44941 RepID=A0A397VIE9_9GLOM|nr:hypothetical protein C2G38_2174380 [Gigaspora rosea]
MSPRTVLTGPSRFNNILPSYLQLGDTVCSNCYNGIAINSSLEFKQHSEVIRSVETEIEVENTNSTLFFSQAIESIPNILYEREVKEKSQQ